jgi:hypothetical protein
MKLTIDDNIVKKTSTPDGITLTLQEVLAIILSKMTDNPHDILTDLYDRGILILDNSTMFPRLKPFRKYDDLVKRILLLSDQSIPTEDELAPLARALKEIYPKGRKTDSVPWQDSLTSTIDRLKGLYKNFPEIKDYSHDDIIKATQRYVNMFPTDRTLMRSLNYFLWKRDETIFSDLLRTLENPDSTASDFYDSAELI